MKTKPISELSFAECCEALNLKSESVEYPLSLQELAEVDRLILDRLNMLLEEQKAKYESCTTIAELNAFAKRYPKSSYAAKARQRVVELEAFESEKKFYELSKGSVATLAQYLKRYPQGNFADAVREEIAQLRKLDREAFESCSTIEQYDHYLANYPNGEFRKEAAQRAAKYRAIKEEKECYLDTSLDPMARYERYLERYPQGAYATEARQKMEALIDEKRKRREKRNRMLRRFFFALLAVGTISFVTIRYFWKPVSILNCIANFEVDESIRASIEPPRAGNYAYYNDFVKDCKEYLAYRNGPERIDGGFRIGNKGGEYSYTIETNAKDILLVNVPSWLKYELTDSSLTFTIDENRGIERGANIDLLAYSLLYGIRVGAPIIHKFHIVQDSGNATFLITSSKELTFENGGGTESVEVITDGFWEICQSTFDWGHLSVEDDNLIKLTLDSCPNYYHREDLFVLQAGDIKSGVVIKQYGHGGSNTSPSNKGSHIYYTNDWKNWMKIDFPKERQYSMSHKNNAQEKDYIRIPFVCSEPCTVHSNSNDSFASINGDEIQIQVPTRIRGWRSYREFCYNIRSEHFAHYFEIEFWN